MGFKRSVPYPGNFVKGTEKYSFGKIGNDILSENILLLSGADDISDYLDVLSEGAVPVFLDNFMGLPQFYLDDFCKMLVFFIAVKCFAAYISSIFLGSVSS